MSSLLTAGKGSLCLLPTPMSSDWKRDGSSTASMRRKSPEITIADYHFPPPGEEKKRDYNVSLFIWHQSFRHMPKPVYEDSSGRRKTSSEFIEWMMGLPKGWVTEVPGITRKQSLMALGNGVVPNQARMAIKIMMERKNELN